MSNISNLSINEKNEGKIQLNKNNKDAPFDSCVPSDLSDESGGEEFFDAHEIPIVEESHEKGKDSSKKDDKQSSFPNLTLATTVGSVPETNDDSTRNEPFPSSSSIDPNEATTTKSIDSKIPSIENSGDSGVPLPPPRTKKKKTLTKNTTAIHCENFENQSTSNHSSAESRSVTNSIESTSIHHNPYHNQNLASFLDDIASIKGDLSITEADNDKQSTYGDFIPNIGGKSLIGNQDLAFSNEQLSKLKEISKNYIFKQQQQQQIQSNIDNDNSNQQQESTTASPTTTSSGTTTTNNSVLNQVMVMDHDTGEKVPLSRAENILPKCLNPLSLHLMKLTNTELDDDTIEKEQSSSSIADSTFKSVTSLISNTLIEMKIEKKDRTLEKKNKKKLLEACESNCDEFEEDDDEDEDYKNSDYKNGGIRSKIKDLKRIVPGLIKNVKGVKTPSSKKRSTFHVDPGEVDVVPPAPPRYKIKVNHKRGTADFDGLKLIQEINDCKGAIWCMKFSNCSQLLAAAGQDNLLRVYCCQKSWKYFTQLRNKASSGQQHNSPTSTKERSGGGGSNGDSFGRVQTSQKSSSYSRNGSLNTCDSHNNSSSSSNSSALNKEFYKDEDNTLSEEGPLLLFTIYRGHTGDVLDLAWSKNHFILSSSMDKTVRLWHITRIECLCTFRHIDFVTTIQFHPRDDRYFLSGSLDGKLRLWNIPDKRVTLWNEVPALPSQRENNVNDSDMNPSNGLITASSFVQNGKFAVIGTYDGRIIFYTTDQLKYFTQIHVNSKNMGSTSQSRFRTNKVTGVESIDITNKILVTTNDSRLRLYDLRDLSLTCKYKGCINQSSQIKAAVSHDQKYIICGSENNSFYIWRVQDNSTIGQRRDRNKQYECIRLLNIPTSQSAPLPPPPPPPPPPSSTMEKDSNLDNNSSTLSYSHGGNSTTATNNTNNTTTSSGQKSVVSSKVTSGGGSSSGFDHSTSTSTSNNMPTSSSNTTQAASSSYSLNAATKIVTSAIFASVPSQIEDKARYIIAAADFNGYIRIFSKQ